MERDAGEGDGRGDSVIARDLEGIFQLAAKSAPVFPAPFIKSIVFPEIYKKNPFQTLIARQSYQQTMSHYIIKKAVLAISLMSSERTSGLPLTGDFELSE